MFKTNNRLFLTAVACWLNHAKAQGVSPAASALGEHPLTKPSPCALTGALNER
jgi:hypothetical protein